METTKWQYCAIKSSLGIKHFDSNGEHKVIKFPEEDKDFHKAIAKLGNEGWELISLASVPGSSDWVYYFKKSC